LNVDVVRKQVRGARELSERMRLIADVQICVSEFLADRTRLRCQLRRDSIFDDRFMRLAPLNKCIATLIVIPEELVVTLAARERGNTG
jgi:hypothetical protein